MLHENEAMLNIDVYTPERVICSTTIVVVVKNGQKSQISCETYRAQ